MKKTLLYLIKSPIFLIGLCLKLAFSFLFASDYLTKLFVKFINYHVISGFKNPYDFFLHIGSTNVFPYPSLMLWILSIPRLLFSPWLSTNYQTVTQLHIFVYRIPLIIADIVILFILCCWLKTKQKKVLCFYWCSPILFYISYIHGQLDAIPIAFLMTALFFLFKGKNFRAAFFLGLAIACKTNILIAVPFYMVYLLKKHRDQQAKVLLSLAVILVTFGIINLPYLCSEGFQRIVFETREQFKVFNLVLPFTKTLFIYIVPAVYLILMINSLTFNTFNRDIFLMYVGFAFSVLTVLIPPMQGWYFWTIPFIVYFYIKQDDAPYINYMLLNIFYFVYFAVIRESDYLQVFQCLSYHISHLPNLYSYLSGMGYHTDTMVNLSLTGLQTTLFMNGLWIYRKGVLSNLQYKIKYKPFLIGIAGDSGAGKSTFSTLLKQAFGESNTLVICGDDMHKWERGDQHWQDFTHLNPMANRLHEDLEHALNLKNGHGVRRKHYQHQDGKFSKEKRISANQVVIIEGLHSLYINRMRQILDLKVYINPDEQLRRHWKAVRDMETRNHKKEDVLAQIKQREEDSEKYIRLQEEFADITIAFTPKSELKNIGDKNEVLDIILKLRFENDVNVQPLITSLETIKSLNTVHSYNSNHQFLELDGTMSKEAIGIIAEILMPELEDLYIEPKWLDGYNGLIQLFTTYYMFKKMELDVYDVRGIGLY